MARISKKDEFQERIGVQMDHVKAGLMELKARARSVQLDARLEYRKQVEALEKKQKELKARVGGWKKAGRAAGKDLEKGIERSARELGKAVERAFGRLK
jgi:hypothetical protein